ncbi:hypothetical protein LNKW23_10720 [Paralimibaculum aggregatum]|uniref:DUF4214 domain-containing protein n=1 Tax=Paralimibaculum aggregatum TaxID=3036245 RepID=A0ABQ6LET7_9RHOB|nr:DUF4214 domain-containing protein [Limibaculum sp. NKW23]GMG81859.1 hypothetical protein LNKW23_10720 [Limibaculum sp. NKW23]
MIELANFVRLPGGINMATGPEGGVTQVFRTNLSATGFTTVTSITITDTGATNTGIGRFSGFDLDGLVISTALVQSAAAVEGIEGSSIFPGNLSASDVVFRPGENVPGPDPGPLVGTDAEGNLLLGEIRLGDLGNASDSGFLSLGRGGEITITFPAPLVLAPNTYLYLGEWDPNGESVGGEGRTARVVVDGRMSVDGGIEGDAGPNLLHGTAGNDTLRGLDGNDTLEGLGGNDRLEGGNGRDTLRGQAGNDQLFGSAGGDRLEGGDGADTLDGGAGFDTLFGQGGADAIFAGADADTVFGGAGNDFLDGNDGFDSLDGGGGNDFIDGDNGNDTLLGGDGADTLDGWTGNDLLRGGGGHDSLLGFSGADTLEGGDGNDTLLGESEADRLLGGNGNDVLDGGPGSDTVLAGNGNDQILMFPLSFIGNEVIDGGGGRDAVVYDGARSAFTITEAGGSVTVAGPGGIDTLTGVDTLEFADGATVFLTTARIRSGFSLVDAEANREIGAVDIAFLYEAGLNRNGAIDSGGLNFWIDVFEGDYVAETNLHGQGLSFNAIALFFFDSAEFAALVRDAYGLNATPDNISNAQYLDLLYENILGREPEPLGRAFWLSALDAGLPRHVVLAEFAKSPENQTVDPPFDPLALEEVEPGTWEIGSGGQGATNGNDTLQGTSGADFLNGLAGNDVLLGFGGGDTLVGAEGDDTVDGGSGFDTAVFASNFSEYIVVGTASLALIDGPSGFDELIGIELLEFADVFLTLPDSPVQAIEDEFALVAGNVFALDVLANDLPGADFLDLAVIGVDGSGLLGSISISQDRSTILYDTEDAFDFLAPGEVIFESFSYSVTDGFTIEEASVVVAVEGAGGGLADMVIDFFDITDGTSGDSFFPGDPVFLTMSYGNLGGEPGDLEIGFYLSPDANVTTSDIFLDFVDVGVVGPGEFGSIDTANPPILDGEVAFDIPDGLAPGTYWIAAIADDIDDITESNEANNTSFADDITVFGDIFI